MDSTNLSPIAISTVVADIVISIAYFAIPIEIWFFQRSLSRPLPFKYILVFFELFIAACGLTHLVGVWSPWTRTDPALLAVKILCALISSTTAIVMITVIPKVFSFPARAALMEEELGLRIRHEHSLQRANELLIKFRKITNSIRQTLDVNTICESAVMELCVNLKFTGMALFLPNEDGIGFTCQAEFINTSTNNKSNLAPIYQTHYWKTIIIDANTPVIQKISSVSCTCYLSGSDLVMLANKQRGMLYRSGLAMSFHVGNNIPRGFIIAFNETESCGLSEDGAELFEDVVSQIEIALQQARQIQTESLHLGALQRQLMDNANLDNAKNSAEIASKVKTHLLSSLGNEINTPIMDIAGLVQALHKASLTQDQKELVDLIQTRSKTLDLIMEDLSDFMKLDDHGLILESIPLQIEPTVQQSLVNLNSTLVTKGWTTTFDIDSNVPDWVVGDDKRLKQIIVNIINNLVSSASASGVIRIAVTLNSEPPSDIPFLRDPRCFKFNHHLNPNRSTRPSSHLKSIVYFHIIGTEAVSSPLPNHHDWVKGVGVTPLRPGLGLTVVAHLIQLFGGDLTMRYCAQKGSIYSFAIQVNTTDNEF